METYVIADIHGRAKALKEVLVKSKFNYDEDKLIVLGDSEDGGSNTYEVYEELLKIKNVVSILGNHTRWFIDSIFKGTLPSEWINQGGANTLNSYGGKVIPGTYPESEPVLVDVMGVRIPRTHIEFLVKTKLYHIENNMLFVHGGIDPNKPINEQDPNLLLWDRSIIKYAETNNIQDWDKMFIGHTCLTEDSLIYTKDGFKNIKDIDGKILAIHNGKLVFDEVINKSFKKEKVFKIYSNNIIEATAEHKLIVFRDGKQQTIKVSNLKKTDYLLVPKKIKQKGSKQELLWFYKKHNKGRSIKHPKYINKNVAYLLGVILGDGTVYKNTIEINEHYKRNLLIIQKLIKEEFGITSKIFKRKNKNCYRIRINSVEIANSLDIKHKKEYFLNIIGKSDINIRRSFISGLIDSDGSIDRDITISQKDKNVLSIIQWMLLTDGIQSRIREYIGMSYGKIRIWHELRISSFFKTKIYKKYELKYFNRIKNLKKIILTHTKNMKKYYEYGDFIKYDIKKIKYSGIKKVIDLETENTHTFIVNGICSHNSTQLIEREFVNYHCRDCGNEWEKEVKTKDDTMGNPVCEKCKSKNIFQSLGCTKPLKIGNLYCLDTGAGWDGKLTLMNIENDEFWQSSLQTPPIL